MPRAAAAALLRPGAPAAAALVLAIGGGALGAPPAPARPPQRSAVSRADGARPLPDSSQPARTSAPPAHEGRRRPGARSHGRTSETAQAQALEPGAAQVPPPAGAVQTEAASAGGAEAGERGAGASDRRRGREPAASRAHERARARARADAEAQAESPVISAAPAAKDSSPEATVGADARSRRPHRRHGRPPHRRPEPVEGTGLKGKPAKEAAGAAIASASAPASGPAAASPGSPSQPAPGSSPVLPAGLPTVTPIIPQAPRSPSLAGPPLAAGGGAAGEPPTAGAGAPAAVAPDAGAEAPAAPAPTGAHAHADPTSPIVSTVTRIVDVIPPEVRVLLVTLAALALGLGASAAAAAFRSRRLARQRAELLEDVGLMQAALLPPLPARIGPVQTSAAYRPSTGPAAGGDFYDVFALADGRLAVIVGDVSGHGREALPQTTLVRYTLRTWLHAGHTPRAALQAAAPSLERQLEGAFVTVVLATYDPRTRELVYAAAGHPPPLVCSPAGVLGAVTACSAPPIGCGRPTGTRQTRILLAGAATSCFYTDGVVEARTHGELFGRGRLAETIGEPRAPRDAQELLDAVARACERRPDDMAACVLRVDGTAERPIVLGEELEIDAGDIDSGRARRFLAAVGLRAAESASLLREAQALLAGAGAAVIAVEPGEAGVRTSVRPQNVTQINQPPRTAARSGGSR